MSLYRKFDIIICNQVYEHLYDIKQATINLSYLINSNGFIWLTFPASNFHHGSPDYYSSGYDTKIVLELIKDNNLINIFNKTVCNQRTYFFRHLLNIWPDKQQFKYPLSLIFHKNYTNLVKNLLNKLIILPILIFLTLTNSNYTDKKRYQIESVILLKNIIN